jgi:hypothetical protein
LVFQIERSRGLIEEDEWGSLSQHSSQGHSGSLTAGKLGENSLTEMTHISQTQCFLNSVVVFSNLWGPRPRRATHLDNLFDTEGEGHLVGLKKHSAQTRGFVRSILGDVFISQHCPTGGRLTVTSEE